MLGPVPKPFVFTLSVKLPDNPGRRGSEAQRSSEADPGSHSMYGAELAPNLGAMFLRVFLLVLCLLIGLTF